MQGKRGEIARYNCIFYYRGLSRFNYTMQIDNYHFLLSQQILSHNLLIISYFILFRGLDWKLFFPTLNLNRLILLRQDINPKTTPGLLEQNYNFSDKPFIKKPFQISHLLHCQYKLFTFHIKWQKQPWGLRGNFVFNYSNLSISHIELSLYADILIINLKIFLKKKNLPKDCSCNRWQ